MTGILIQTLQFVASLSMLVLIHEFGHFITARMFGVRVDRFYLFFNNLYIVITHKICIKKHRCRGYHIFIKIGIVLASKGG